MDARARILDAARARIVARTYPAPIRTLAAEAGVAVSTIYATFADRDAIAYAAADELLAADVAALPDDDLHAYLEALVAHRAARMVATRPLLLGLLALPETWPRVSHRAALREPAFAPFARTLAQHRDELALAPTPAAELAAIALRGVLLGALEERAQYLSDPAFLAECTSMVEHIACTSPRPFRRVFARSHAHTFHRTPEASRGLRKQPAQDRSRELVEHIVDGTQRVVERAGVDAVTTPRVAETTGVSIGSLYQYFSNRGSLLGALTDRWIARDLAFTERRLAAETSPSAAVLLDNLGLEWHARMTQLAPIYRGLFAVFARLERAGAVRDFLAHSRDLTTRAIERRDDARGLDAELMSFVLGHMIIALCRALSTERPALLGSPELTQLFHRLAHGPLQRSA